MSLRIALVGYGRMGKAIDAISDEHGCHVVERLDIHNNRNGEGLESSSLNDVDVAIEFSLPESVVSNVTKLAARGINVIIGTTGWEKDEPVLRRLVKENHI